MSLKSQKEICTWSIGYGYNPEKKLLHFLGCKRRQCETCGWFWAWKWRSLLKHKIQQDENKGIVIRRAISLTTSYDAGYQKCWMALKYFWRFLRKDYPNVQYWGVTEYNQKHTQPHFHFILDKDKYIEQKDLQTYWMKAQAAANFEKIAWNVRIEQIKENIEKYFTKYVTKLTGGKDEIPRPENWQGRYVRYSRKFFANGLSTKDILSALAIARAANDEYLFSRSYYDIFPKFGVHSAMGQGIFKEYALREEIRNCYLDDKWARKYDEKRLELHGQDYQTSIEFYDI